MLEELARLSGETWMGAAHLPAVEAPLSPCIEWVCAGRCVSTGAHDIHDIALHGPVTRDEMCMKTKKSVL